MKIAASIIGGLLAIAYPILIYYGLSRFSVRAMGLVIAVLVIAGVIVRGRGKFATVASPAVGVLALVALSAVLEDQRFILAMPALINLVLLITFGRTLTRDRMPMIERFARLQTDVLNDDQLGHCRAWTTLWCGFFFVNGLAAAVLAVFAPIAWWTLYTGLIAYVLMGLMFAVEFVIRRYRFREYGGGLHDRILRALFGQGAR